MANLYLQFANHQLFRIGVLLYRDDEEYVSMIANEIEHQKLNFEKKYNKELIVTFKDAKQNQFIQN